MFTCHCMILGICDIGSSSSLAFGLSLWFPEASECVGAWPCVARRESIFPEETTCFLWFNFFPFLPCVFVISKYIWLVLVSSRWCHESPADGSESQSPDYPLRCWRFDLQKDFLSQSEKPEGRQLLWGSRDPELSESSKSFACFSFQGDLVFCGAAFS